MSMGLPIARALDAGRVPTVAWLTSDIVRLPVTYGYVTTSALVVLGVFGWLLGRWCDRAERLSVTDPLTGVFNRRYFGERLLAETHRARRDGDSTCVLCLDLDRLKRINDASGHKAGDRALVSAARILSSSVRPTDVVARLGGDEFAVLLPKTTAGTGALIAERILSEVARHREAPASRFDVSIGIAELSDTGSSDDVMAIADSALYRAKAEGGGHASIAQPGVAWLMERFTRPALPVVGEPLVTRLG